VTGSALAWSPAAWGERSLYVAQLRTFRPEAAAWLLIVVVIGIEAVIDPALTALLGWDFTSLMPTLEGRSVDTIQAAVRTPAFDILFTTVYTYGYFVLYGLLPAILILRMDPVARPILRTILLAWAIGIPCYLFVPVDEPWAVGYATAVMHETVPAAAKNELVGAAINNELPSLHSMLSVAIATTAWLAGRRRLAALLSPLAIGVPLATIYLGVHWVTDAVTGVVLGILAAYASRDPRWLRRLLPNPNPKAENTPTV